MDRGPSRMTSESWFCFQCKLRSLFSGALTQKAKPEDTAHCHQALCCPQRTLSSETREGGGHRVHMGGDGSTVSRQVLLLLQPLRITFGPLVHREALKTRRCLVHLLSKGQDAQLSPTLRGYGRRL